jgi:predicted O-linked N-acetylglucosamine transferase (SPINDLY family)
MAIPGEGTHSAQVAKESPPFRPITGGAALLDWTELVSTPAFRASASDRKDSMPLAASLTPAARASSALRVASAGSPGNKHWSQGVSLAREGRLPEAAAAFERAIGQAPGTALYWLNLASVRRRQRRVDEATRCARRAFELDSRSVPACQMLVELLRAGNRHAQALEVLNGLHPDVPRDGQHWLLDGALHMALRNWQAAAIAFLKVLGGKPDHVEAYQQLGFALANLTRHSDAAECFRTIVTLEPEQLGAAIYSAHYAAWACDWAGVAADEQRLAQAIDLLGDGTTASGLSPFCLLSLNDDAAMHRRAAGLASAHVAREARHGHFSGGWKRPPAGPEGYPAVRAQLRCRIGFVSADFRTHATSMLLVQTLERLDRSRFEVLLYSHGRDDGSALRQRVVAAVDGFVECAEMSTAEQAQRIRDDGVAILVDLSGFTASTRLGVLALRPAPIQVLWLAYPSTTGSDFIDYVIGDPVLTPLDHADDFSEKIAQLPVCYEPTDELREHPDTSTRAEAGLPADAFVYACFNQSYKITEPVFSRWCRILQRVPHSVLWLLVPQPDIQAALLAQAAARGIAAERIVFAPFVTPTEHLARLPLADLFLDTFPYGAHTTCSDALWMGLPVLTQVGRSFSARVAASLLGAVGLPELAVANEHDYEELAVRLSADAEARNAIRAHLNDNRLALPLFDNTRFSADLGALFARMAERWNTGLPPTHLAAAS